MDKNLFQPILVCNTGQIKPKTKTFPRPKQSVTTVMKFWGNADNFNCYFAKNVKKCTRFKQSVTTVMKFGSNTYNHNCCSSQATFACDLPLADFGFYFNFSNNFNNSEKSAQRHSLCNNFLNSFYEMSRVTTSAGCNRSSSNYQISIFSTNLS